MPATSQEGPWKRARHFAAVFTKGSSDASSATRGGVVNTILGTFPSTGVFATDWLSKHINMKEMDGLYHLLRCFCTRHPGVLRRAQGLVDVGNQPIVDA